MVSLPPPPPQLTCTLKLYAILDLVPHFISVNPLPLPSHTPTKVKLPFFTRHMTGMNVS